MPKDDRQLDRRGFFQELLTHWVRPAAKQAEQRVESYLPEERRFLRPPGAIPEREFLHTCFHSGNCVDSCPANAIQTYLGEDEDLIGTPIIDPDKQPCVVCESLACMQACPSGALRSLELREIQMGEVLWQEDQCIRTSGEECTLCIDRCPLRTEAIRLGDDGRICLLQGCIGCGVCQYHCPTGALRVQPI